ncbi:MAG: fructosamine kinase family protein [Anaerolineae bacterium]
MVELQTDLALTHGQAERVLAAWLDSSVRCTGIERLRGGMINSVLRLTFDRAPHTAVIKLNEKGNGFAGEAHALRHLRERGFPCPDVYLHDARSELIPYTFLLLEALPGVSLGEARLLSRDMERIEGELAEVLIALHTHTRDTFGPIDAAGETDWTAVFMPRLRAVRAKPEVERRLPASVLQEIDRAIDVAPDLLQAQGRPTLIHGDIWAANVMVHEAGDGWHLSGLVDPSAEYADVEMELAYLRVFHTAGQAFFARYTQVNPLRPGYELRWLIYWLRTYLVHVWLFGDQHYRDRTALIAQEIVART